MNSWKLSNLLDDTFRLIKIWRPEMQIGKQVEEIRATHTHIVIAYIVLQMPVFYFHYSVHNLLYKESVVRNSNDCATVLPNCLLIEEWEIAELYAAILIKRNKWRKEKGKEKLKPLAFPLRVYPGDLLVHPKLAGLTVLPWIYKMQAVPKWNRTTQNSSSCFLNKET